MTVPRAASVRPSGACPGQELCEYRDCAYVGPLVGVRVHYALEHGAGVDLKAHGGIGKANEGHNKRMVQWMSWARVAIISMQTGCWTVMDP